MSKIFPRVYAEPWADYELIDAGGGKKLERFGKIILIRPELQAYFQSEKSFLEWKQLAHAEFREEGKKKGSWKFYKTNTPESWLILAEKVILKLEFTQFKHIGIFPEQQHNWTFLTENLGTDKKFLNLFAYTGAASLIARKTGADVTHVDSVKHLLNWSRENMELNQLSDIRWVLDDALKFAQREIKRGNKYHGIIMDPPAYGIGIKGEKWILEQQLPELLKTTAQLLEKNGFLIMNTYSPKVSAEDIKQLAQLHFKNRKIQVNELWMNSTSEKELFFGNLLRVM